jgi:signal transduction histidine kinase
LSRATRSFSKVACDLTERKRALEAVDEVQWAERERLTHDLQHLVLQDLIYALQAGEVYRATRKEDKGEGVFDLGEMIPSPPRARRCA